MARVHYKQIKRSMDYISRQFKKLIEPSSAEHLSRILEQAKSKLYWQVMVAVRENGEEVFVEEMGNDITRDVVYRC